MFKNILKKIVLSVILASSLFTFQAGISAETTYAAVECPPLKVASQPDPIQPTASGNYCLYKGAKTCPSEFLPISDQPDEDGNQICRPKIKQDSKTLAATRQNLTEQINGLTVIGNVLGSLLWPILVLIGGLMDNSLLFGEGMEARLREIWIPMRNLVNILFVLILVGIALYNVLGLGEDNSQYSIKSALPKIVVGIIAINFSFLGIKVFLDAINVLTVSIFAIPGEVSRSIAEINLEPSDEIALCSSLTKIAESEAAGETEGDKELQIIRDVAGEYKLTTNAVDLAGIKAEIATALEDHPTITQEKFDQEVQARKAAAICSGGRLNSVGKQFLARYNSKNAAFAMAINMGQVHHLKEVDFSSLQNIEDLAINVIFSVVLFLIYTTSFLALFVVLLGRLVVMWISIAISPLLLLLLAAPDLKSKLGGLSEVTDQFVKNAIAPVIIALAMTVGWIMLDAIKGVDYSASEAFKVDPSAGIPVVGLNTLQNFMVSLGTIGVIWTGVFAAAKGTIAEGVVTTIGDGVKKAGKWLGALPLKHTPFIPIKTPNGEGNYSVAEVLNTVDTLTNRLTDNTALTKALNLTPVAGKNEALQIRSKQDLLKHLGENFKHNGDLSESSYEGLRANTTHLPNIIRQLRSENTPNSRKLAEQLTELQGSKDFKTFKSTPAFRDMKRNPYLEDAIKAASAGTAGTAAAAATAAPSYLTVNNKAFNTVYDRKSYTKDGKFDEARYNNDVKTAADTYEASLDQITRAIEADPDDPQIKALYNKLQISGKDGDGNPIPTRPTYEDVVNYYNNKKGAEAKKYVDALERATSKKNPTPPSP